MSTGLSMTLREISNVSDQPSLVPSLEEIVQASQISYPNTVPYTHITFCLVAWNEAHRLPRLLARVRPYFERLIVGVQSSSDRTLDVAREFADDIVMDDRRGYGDATFGPKLLPLVRTRWTFKLDADEWPDEVLLSSLSNATWYAETHGYDGVWIPFRSSVDGIEYTEQHSHLRLFETQLGWPGTLHSRPPAKRSMLWSAGHIRHDRTLDEMMQDYLRYWYEGKGNIGWETHNRLMMYSACTGTAAVKGWEYVQKFPWWPEVEAIAFSEEKPWLQP